MFKLFTIVNNRNTPFYFVILTEVNCSLMVPTFEYQKNPNFSQRYILPENLHQYIQENLSDYCELIGVSTLGLPIYQCSFGFGDIKVLAWSQMHGNESNSTLSMLDLLYSLENQPELKDRLFKNISLDFIFMLNPDGSKAWTRRNALDIDMNRDYLQEASCEMKLLKKIAFSKHYDYGFNLHEQRTIFSTDGKHPATLSFLAPSEDVDRTITETRKKSMAVINAVYNALKLQIPNHIARYSDEFYPTSTGDNLMKAGIPVILFEGGHYEEDYLRENTRKYYTIALYTALSSISLLNKQTIGFEGYFDIPENKESHFDIIYRNVKLNTDFDCILDIAVQYKEEILKDETEISFIPYVVEVGDLSRKKGWKEIDCAGKKFVSEAKFPKLDAIQSFTID